MYNDYILGIYAKQRHADLLQQAEKARLANNAIKVCKALMKKSEKPVLPDWRSSLRNFSLILAHWISQVFHLPTEAAERAPRKAHDLAADKIHEATEYS